MIKPRPAFARLALASTLAIAGAAGCSGKPPETDTAEVVVPAVKPAPGPTPPAQPPAEPAKDAPKG